MGTSDNRISGWSYDGAGNLLNDGSHSYTYNAENKLRSVDGTTAYVYDGDGQRVRKLVGENLRFTYGISGAEIAEFDGSTGALKKECIYSAGGLLKRTKADVEGTSNSHHVRTSCSFARSTAAWLISFMTASCHVAFPPTAQTGHFTC